jgi:hypothetical protein
MMTRLTMRGLLIPLFVLAASVVGCGETSDEESAPSSAGDVGEVAEVAEGLRLRAPLPSTGKAGGDGSKSNPGVPNGFESETGPGKPGDDRMEPTPQPWDPQPRVRSANDA